MNRTPVPAPELSGPAGAVRRRLAAFLADAFGDERAGNAALDARLITAAALGIDPSDLLRLDETVVDPAAAGRIAALAARRAAGEPVARLLGVREFWSLPFALSAETLVPRPETETLVAAALAAAGRMGGRDATLRLLDLGTGTGAILLALLSELPGATGLGTDISADALETAGRNAAALGLAGRATFRRTRWAEGVEGRFDLVLSNPPYIESGAMAALPAEVRADPPAALDGGPDGLDAYRAILSALPGLLAPGGRAFLEIGAGQGDAVAAIAGAASLGVLARHADLAGLERVLEIAATAANGAATP